MEYQTYKLDFGWEISVPEGWKMEKKEVGSFFFYPDDPEDETTIYASALHAEDHQILTPEYVMRAAYEKSIPEHAQEVGIITSVHCKAYFHLGADGSYTIGAGYFTDGDLLSLNVYATDETKARAAASGFANVKHEREGGNAV